MDAASQDFARDYWANNKATFFPNRWAGVLCWQNPFDVWIIQEVIGETRPDVIVETGTLAGGGAVLWASLLKMFGDGRVITIDVNKEWHAFADTHPLAERITFVTGSSTDPDLVAQIAESCTSERVMVILDSDHTAAHVTAELDLWAPHVTPGCYLIVEDGFVTYVEPELCPGPLEATLDWLPAHPEFEVDTTRERMGFTFAPSGFLRRRDRCERHANGVRCVLVEGHTSPCTNDPRYASSA